MANKYVDHSIKGTMLLAFGETYTECVAGDLGKAVVGVTTGDTGKLMYYDNTAKKWWVKPDEAGDLWDEAGGEAITITSGTGQGTTSGAAVTAYNGDGTASAPAQSASGTGCWIDLIECFKGSVGYAPAAGDNVYVRTKDGASANITAALAASITFSTTPTVGAHITWYSDAGSVWTGFSGILTINVATASDYIITFSSYHDFVGTALNFVFYDSYAGTQYWLTVKHNLFRNIKFSLSQTTGNIPKGIAISGFTVFDNCYFAFGHCWTSVTSAYNPLTISAFCLATFNACTFDMTGSYNGGNPLFGFAASAHGVIINGGSAVSVGEYNKYMFCLAGYTGNYAKTVIRANGFDPGKFILRDATADLGSPDWTTPYYTDILISNIKGGRFDFTNCTGASIIDWRYQIDGNLQNYPTLNAKLPDATPWSLKVTPKKASTSCQVPVTIMTKLYTAAAAIKTVTVEMLINSLYSPTGDQWYMEVFYIDDSTGLGNWCGLTLTTGSLSSSTAEWTATIYGAENYGKWKLSYTLPSSVKQYSDIIVNVFQKVAPPSATSFFFVDPDFTIS